MSYIIEEKIKTLEDKNYCCPFCSHGETIDIIVRTNVSPQAWYYNETQHVLRCPFCRFEKPFGVININRESATLMANELFKKLIKFTKDKVNFITC